MKSIFLVLFILILFFKQSYSQWEAQTQNNAQSVSQKQITTFGSRSSSPIKIEVMKKDGQYAFKATNKSLYPYILNLKVSKTVNLDPASFERTFVLQPGRNNLVTLRRRNRDDYSTYSYTYTYSIGDPYDVPDEDFSYLLPIGDGNRTKLFFPKKNKNIYMRNCFAMQEGDTVYCMRKGYVMAIPGMYNVSDRIARSNSLEIRHADGSVMIYENINDDVVFTDLSRKVYPGQALGVIGAQKHLKVKLYSLAGKNKLKRLKIKYYFENESIEYSYEFKELNTEYPVELIKKEMSKREVKKYEKGTLVKLKD